MTAIVCPECAPVVAGLERQIANLKDILATERAADVQLVKEAEERGRASERADVLAFVTEEHAKFRRGESDPENGSEARARCGNKASALTTLSAYLERGDHDGAHERARASK